MSGKPDHSSAPIEQSQEGTKEIYLRGGDYRWCPSVYHEGVGEESAAGRGPNWTLTMESPPRYVPVTDGELVRREESNGVAKAEWKSLVPGTPHLYVGPYRVVSRTVDGVTFEMYAADEQQLRKAAANLDRYGRIFNLYSELYGNLGVRTYRIVCSDVAGVGVGTIAGQTISTYMVNDLRHIAHEMAHAWWGHWVSPCGPGWKFLTEAMAEFSARWVLFCAFGEDNFDHSLTDECILGWKQRQFCCCFPVNETPPRFSVPLMLQAGYDSQNVAGRNYFWGPLVVNHTRIMLGDEMFFRCLKTFLDEYGGKRAGIEEFLQTFDRVSGKDVGGELKGLLWTTGFASYCLAGFVSERGEGGYHTKIRIRNEGDYGLTCPLLLKTIGGEQRTVFKVEGKQEKELLSTNSHRVIEVVIDPEQTTLQYHPEQKLRLWKTMLRTMGSLGYANNEAYGKSYIYYAQGEFRNATGPISDFLCAMLRRENVNSIDELLKKQGWLASYVFMRGIFHLALDDQLRAEEDIKSAFPHMLRAMVHEGSVLVPSAYYEVGAIARNDLGEYLALLGLIAGREFSFANASDDAAKQREVEEWQQWWDKEGKTQKLALGPLKARAEAQRKACASRLRRAAR